MRQMRWDKVTPELVQRMRSCDRCGRQFQLDYDPQTGEAQQTWQLGCDTPEACRDRILGPLSDFKANQREPNT